MSTAGETVSNQTEIVEALRTNAKEWVTLDEKEKLAKATLKAVAERKKELGDAILQGLEVIEQPGLKLKTGGRLKYTERTVYAPLKKEDLFSTLKDELKDEDKAREIVDKAYDKERREGKKVVTLTRTKK